MEHQIKIITENLSFSYQNRMILEDINLRLPSNSIIAVTGPSGTGKSTLLSVFNRLWEENGDGTLQGKVFIHFTEGLIDIYSNAIQCDELRRRVGMVFQTPNPLPMSIYRNIAFPLSLQPKYCKADIPEHVEEILKKVHLFDEVRDRLDTDANKLSGGQQQRLCIARALILQPEILLLDEPTSSLDAKGCEKIEQLLLELKKDRTILIVSHYQDQIHRIADQVYRMVDKKLEMRQKKRL